MSVSFHVFSSLFFFLHLILFFTLVLVKYGWHRVAVSASLLHHSLCEQANPQRLHKPWTPFAQASVMSQVIQSCALIHKQTQKASS